MTGADFAYIAAFLKQRSGLIITQDKMYLLETRLAAILRGNDLSSLTALVEILRQPGAVAVKDQVVDAMTTNETSFFRDNHPFEALRKSIIPGLIERRAATRVLRIWSAACSTGQEPYSLAMTVLEAFPDLRGWDVKILATDLDSDVLGKAQRGLYSADRMRNMSPQRLQTFFTEQRGRDGPCYEVIPELRALITFKQLNLMHSLPMKGPMDAIFCRNVVIYFDKDTQRELFARIAQLQRPGDLLFLGHSESLFKVSESYAPIGKTMYRRS